MKPIPCDRCRVSLERVSVPKHHSRPHLIFETSGQGIQARPKQYVSVPDNRSVVPRLRSAAAQPGLIDSEPNRWDESHESTCLDMNQQTQSHTHSGAHTSESIARTLFAVILLMPPATGVSITIDSREKKKKKQFQMISFEVTNSSFITRRLINWHVGIMYPSCHATQAGFHSFVMGPLL